MSGIYIKGFPLPNNCCDCPLRLAWCRERIYMVNRPDRCPLVPVPDHGRLIDASEKIRVQFYDEMTEDFHMAEMTIDDFLSLGMVEADAPTIIPASKGAEG